nr:hypothetical protein [Tanacetum cinerariifolium]
MMETMEQYMSKTRGDYGSSVNRPVINQDTQFELKGKFFKELHDNTFSGSEHKGANEHIKKFLEIFDLFHIPKITQDQIMLLAFLVSLTGATNRWLRNQPSGSITTWEELNESRFRAWERFKELLMKCPQHYLTDMQEVILFYNGHDVPTRQILDSKGAIPSKTDADAKVAINEMAKFSQKWHNETSSKFRSTESSDRLATIQAQLNNLGREIKKVNEKVYVAQDKDEVESHAGTLVDIPVFVKNFSIITGFIIIDDDDISKGVELGMPFCKKYLSCQLIMKKFAHGDEYERIKDK